MTTEVTLGCTVYQHCSYIMNDGMRWRAYDQTNGCINKRIDESIKNSKLEYAIGLIPDERIFMHME